MFFSACEQAPQKPAVPVAGLIGVSNLAAGQPTATRVPAEWIAPEVPDALRTAGRVPGLAAVAEPASATARLQADPSAEIQSPDSEYNDAQATWYYALVAPFPTVVDGLSFEALRQAWTGVLPPAFSNRALLMTQPTYAAMKILLGGEAASGAVRILPADQLPDALWQDRPQWGIVPFELLDPKMKVLEIDGQSPIRKSFNEAQYPLKLSFTCSGPDCADVRLPPTNRDPSKVVTVIMTGVTALVRATAYKMEVNGVLYPGQDIRDTLREADITHISNEIPFAQDCPAPDWNSKRLEFCSAPKYIDLLDDVGADVIELTGNHMEDWSQKAMRYTLQLYQDHGLLVYGGGADLAASHQAATIERDGVKFAFIGCNPVGPVYGWADVGWPGAAPCGDYKWMTDEISHLKKQGYIVIATFQYYEYYTPEPRPRQREVFQMMADAGADIVSGSQAHSAQAMEFDHGSFIHYGLGNLFFDQMNVTDYSRYEFLDRYVFYNGHMVSIDLVTAMLQDYARPQLMDGADRADFLTYIFQASGWLPKSPSAAPKPTPTLFPLP